jgi:hypothetical protein
MITYKKIELFKKFNGDIDHFARAGSPQEKMNISDKDWALIDSFLQDLTLVEKGLAAEGFAISLDIRLKANIDDESVLQHLKETSKNDTY